MHHVHIERTTTVFPMQHGQQRYTAENLGNKREPRRTSLKLWELRKKKKTAQIDGGKVINQRKGSNVDNKNQRNTEQN